MFDDFIPETDLERAFAQASGWEVDRLWKEADRSGDKKDWNRFYGQAFCLVYFCAAEGKTQHLNTTTMAMVDSLDLLTSSQQLNSFKVCSYVINRLLDQNLRLECIEITLLLRILFALLRKPGWNNTELVVMATALTTIFGRILQPHEVDELTARCEKEATSNPKLLDDRHALLRWSITKYSGN